MNAKITNIHNEGETVNVFATFSNGQEKVYYLNIAQANEDSITEMIKNDIEILAKEEKEAEERKEQAEKVAELLSEMKDKIIE